MPLGLKLALTHGGQKLEDRNKDERSLSSKFFFENGSRRALIFGMQHHLVDLYQVCLYDALGVKTGPAPGVTSLNIGTKKANFKILLLGN